MGKRSQSQRLVLTALAIVALAGEALAQRSAPNSGALMQTLPDYSYAGYGYGVATIPGPRGTVIEATRHGVIANDGKDDTVALKAAFAAAHAVSGPVVLQLPEGRVQLSSVLRIERSDFVLSGAGTGTRGTELFIPRPLRLMDTGTEFNELRAYLLRENKYERDAQSGINNLFSEWSWSGGFITVGKAGSRPVSYDPALDQASVALANGVAGQQRARALQVSNAGALRVGQTIRVQWFAGQGAASPILRSIYGNTDLPIGSHHWSFANRATVVQSTKIVAITGDTITLGDPLLHDVRADQPAIISPWDPLVNVGIQDLKITFPDSTYFGHHLEDGWNAIWFTGAFDGWVRNLTIHNADAGVMTDDSANLTIANVRTTGEHRAHYSVHVGSVHNVLVTGLRVENPVIHPLSFNTRSTRSVYTRSVVTREARFDQHSGSNHANLYDAIEMHIQPQQVQGVWTWRLWQGGGAGYWKPGHGLGNTAWNVQIVAPRNVPARAAIALTSGVEGPGKVIYGVHGNRPLSVTYQPQPLSLMVGTAPAPASLYDAQRVARQP